MYFCILSFSPCNFGFLCSSLQNIHGFFKLYFHLLHTTFIKYFLPSIRGNVFSVSGILTCVSGAWASFSIQEASSLQHVQMTSHLAEVTLQPCVP